MNKNGNMNKIATALIGIWGQSPTSGIIGTTGLR